MIDDLTKDNMIRNFAANCIRLGDECREHALEVKRLKAEVERLTKAKADSDVMHDAKNATINGLVEERDQLLEDKPSYE